MTEPDSKATLLTEASNGRSGMKLPKDLYSSKFSYLVRISSFAILIVAIDLLLVIALTLFLSAKKASGGVSGGVLVAAIFFYMSSLFLVSGVIATFICFHDLPTAAKVELLKQTMIQRPALSTELWDVIAAHMNEYFRANKMYLPFYYDGNECHHHFKIMFLNSTAPLPAEPPNGLSDNQHNVNIGNDPNREIRSIVDEAVRLYDQDVNDHWRRQLGEASSQLPEYPGP